MTAAAAHVTRAAMAPGTPQRLQVIDQALDESESVVFGANRIGAVLTPE